MHYNVIYIRSPQVDPKYLHEHPTTKEKPCFPAQPPERTDRPRSLTHLNAFKRIQMYSTELIMLARMAKLNWSPHTQRIQTYLTNLVKSICMVKSHRALLADTLNGFKRVGRLHLQHVWTHSNAFKRIHTDWPSSSPLRNLTESRLERAPGGSCPTREVSVTGLWAHAFISWHAKRTPTGQNTSFRSTRNINIKINRKWNTKENS